MFDAQFDPRRCRLHIRYTGFWSAHDAHAIVDRMRAALAGAAGPAARSFTLLDDLRDWPVQSQEVLEITRGFADLVRRAPVSLNAMIVPSALLRLQVGRTLHDLPNCSIFDTYEEADRWLAKVETVAT
ncbi:hypothetical protein SUS17_2436 [Sphingomonas sp. S17]|jgi:hypothetical protein|uniref:STAS/SEC14 domain-containing protein n=3 Tax=Sphingomonas TaxID=13687 RepID=A0A411LL24_SPHPI|nr:MULTISPECIES: hypothetical protein [Sphingomonas]EGI54821.1 hypothetical protein SUS17_2436 [Sphingomonas sp. S17]MBQ1481749.1 hypothetical protein [Sphingomonas sp.]MCM3681539.1 hypothetical protein [Sphingomonas paucimobilis]MDG5970228.1 hypothetical protein [Sphingomonas paucimobilis]NNG56189.1 hypothetical protein [Sphingomonas paucimobilis]